MNAPPASRCGYSKEEQKELGYASIQRSVEDKNQRAGMSTKV